MECGNLSQTGKPGAISKQVSQVVNFNFSEDVYLDQNEKTLERKVKLKDQCLVINVEDKDF